MVPVMSCPEVVLHTKCVANLMIATDLTSLLPHWPFVLHCCW